MSDSVTCMQVTISVNIKTFYPVYIYLPPIIKQETTTDDLIYNPHPHPQGITPDKPHMNTHPNPRKRIQSISQSTTNYPLKPTPALIQKKTCVYALPYPSIASESRLHNPIPTPFQPNPTISHDLIGRSRETKDHPIQRQH